MNFVPLEIPNCYLIELSPKSDDRGSFTRLYCANLFKQIGLNLNFVQVNLSKSKLKGTFRGMHFQSPPFADYKLIKCMRGAIHDYIVDLRKSSPVLFKHQQIELSEDIETMLLIAPGVAHGFQTLVDKTELLYFHTEFYNPIYDTGVRYNDQLLQINLSLPISIMSDKDKNYQLLPKNFEGLSI